MTLFLIAVTVVSKLIGFAREMILLGSVGISAGLDLLVVFFGFSTFIAGVVGTCVVTNLTPLIANSTSRQDVASILIEGVKVAGFLTCILLFWNFTYLFTVLDNHAEIELAAILAALMPFVLFFALISEYQVAIFLSRNNQWPVIAGNIFISLPLIVGMVFFELTLESYAIGLTLAFAFRAILFAVLLRPQFSNEFVWWIEQFTAKPVMARNFVTIVKGGSAMLTMNFIFLFALMFAERQSEGAATLIGYGRKIPSLVLTSIWFVLGSKFFSQIVQEEGKGGSRKIAKLTKINTILTLFLLSGVLILSAFINWIDPPMSNALRDFMLVLTASLPLLPIIVFVPVIEMVQRTLVTLGQHALVFRVSRVMAIVAVMAFLPVFLFVQSPHSIMLAITASLACAVPIAFSTLKKAERKSGHG